jgi:hypothetical protein
MRHAVRPFVVRDSTIIFPQGRFLRIPKQLGSGNVMMVAYVGAAKPADRF